MKKVVLEGLLVAAIGGLLAFCGNALSPRGISLSRDFFPGSKTPAPNPQTSASTNPAVTPTRTPGTEVLAQKLKAQGLELAGADRVIELFKDPRRAQNQIVFIDARDDSHYQAGHIPGAYQFDHFRAERFLGTVVPAVQAAELVVVYCKGGECEDSEHAALTLSNFVPKEKLLIYAGGITEWMAKGSDVETGERNSGLLRKGQ